MSANKKGRRKTGLFAETIPADQYLGTAGPPKV
jgi:hypothetical protein